MKDEFEARVRIEESHAVYQVDSYRRYDDSSCKWYDYKEQEFNKLTNAQKFIRLYRSNGPEYKTRITEIRESIVYDKRNRTLKYRNGRIRSVDGYKIAHDKCAYECTECGAIWESKGPASRKFATDDPRCQRCYSESHRPRPWGSNDMHLEKICVCKDLVERAFGGIGHTNDDNGEEPNFKKDCI